MEKSLSKMSRKELESLHKRIQRALARLETKERHDASNAIRKLARSYGFEFEDLMTNTTAFRSEVPGKLASTPSANFYTNPKDQTETWNGKGRHPIWFKEAMGEGIEPDQMRLTLDKT